MVENNVESVREKGRYLETIINRKKRTIPIASIEYVESRGRKIVLHLGCGIMDLSACIRVLWFAWQIYRK